MADTLSAKKSWVLTAEAFDRLLDWLNPDRELAGEKYEEIRSALIKIFTCRGCNTPEDLADETINRVAKKIEPLVKDYQGDPALYFYGVAQMIHLEYLRRRPEPAIPDLPRPLDNLEAEHQCLDECLGALAPGSRELILAYYNDESRAKIDNRVELAARLGISLNALRSRAHRLRQTLERCVESCLSGNARNRTS